VIGDAIKVSQDEFPADRAVRVAVYNNYGATLVEFREWREGAFYTRADADSFSLRTVAELLGCTLRWVSSFESKVRPSGEEAEPECEAVAPGTSRT
jgi:hypothetical protein